MLYSKIYYRSSDRIYGDENFSEGNKHTHSQQCEK